MDTAVSNSFITNIPQTTSVQISTVHSIKLPLAQKKQPLSDVFEESHISVPDIFDNQTFLLPQGPWSLYKILGLVNTKEDWLEHAIEILETNEKEISKKLIQRFQASYALFNTPRRSPYLESDILELSKDFIANYGLIDRKSTKEVEAFQLSLAKSKRAISQFQLKLNANNITIKSLDEFKTFLFCPAWELDKSLMLYGLRLHIEEVSPMTCYAIQHSTMADDLTLKRNFNSGVFFCYIVLFYYIYSKSTEQVTNSLLNWKKQYYDHDLKSMFKFYAFMFETFDCFPAI